jgi:hypothetical protein
VFKNTTRGEVKAPRRFINDTVRSDFHRRCAGPGVPGDGHAPAGDAAPGRRGARTRRLLPPAPRPLHRARLLTGPPPPPPTLPSTPRFLERYIK